MGGPQRLCAVPRVPEDLLGRAHGEGAAPEGGARLAQKEEVLPAWERTGSRKWVGGSRLREEVGAEDPGQGTRGVLFFCILIRIWTILDLRGGAS